MKKVNFRNALMALVVTLAFVVSASAQVTPAVTTMNGGAFNPVTGNFVSNTDAQDILWNEMLSLKATMENQFPAPLAAFERLFVYYNGVYGKLESGMPVSQAIVEGLQAVLGPETSNIPSPSVLNALKQSAIDLLDI